MARAGRGTAGSRKQAASLLLVLAGWFAHGAAPANDTEGGGDAIARVERLRETGAPPPTGAIPHQPAQLWRDTGEVDQLAGARGGRAWWRITPVPGKGERLLLVYHPFSARLTVLAPPDYRPQRASIFDPDLDASHSRRALFFPLPDTTQPIYVGAEAARYPLQVAIRTPREHGAADIGHVRVLWLSAGMLIGVLLVTLLFWTLLRERVYLLFTATMLTQLLYILLAFGDAYAVPMFAWMAPFGVEGIWFVATVSIIVSVFFLIDYAELRPRAPQLSRALWLVGVLMPTLLLIALVQPWPRDKSWFPLVGNPMLMAANLLAIGALLAAWRRGGRHAGYVLIAWVPLVSVSTIRAVQLSSGRPLTSALEYGLPLLQAFAAVVLVLEMAHRMLTVRRERDAAKADAEHDPLTGVFNRAGAMERLDRSIDDSRRRGTPLSVLFLDLDHFKRINDTHGHAVGDACLAAVTRVIRDEMQPAQQLGRIGGEEFLLVLPDAPRRHARELADRIRQQVEVLCAKVRGAPVELTLSIGVVECDPDDTAASLLQRADEAMYQAKHEGRNRVVSLESMRPRSAG